MDISPHQQYLGNMLNFEKKITSDTSGLMVCPKCKHDTWSFSDFI